MSVKRKKSKNNLTIAVFFGMGVGLIILTSLILKGIDLFRDSKFDTRHRLSVAIIRVDGTHVLSISPSEGTMFRLDVKGLTDEDKLKDLSVPIDAYIKVSPDYKIEDTAPKSEFSKLLFKLGKIKTDLSFIDLVRLTIYSGSINSDKIDERKVNTGDIAKIDDISSAFFKDPKISSEKVNIQITNTTEVTGLGNKLAKYIANLGGTVILVNSSSKATEISKIIYRQESDTVKRLSKILGIPFEKGRGSDLADVIIVIGEDKKGSLFK